MQIQKNAATTVATGLAALVACGAMSMPVVANAYADDISQNQSIVMSQPKELSYIGDYEGYITVKAWEDAREMRVDNTQTAIQNVISKMDERPDADWGGFKEELVSIRNDMEASWSVDTAKEAEHAAWALEEKADRAIAERDAQIEAERIAAEEEAARIAAEEAAAAAAASYSSSYSGGGYYPSGGLTPQSGVNYYGDQRETYYSSNVLYHYNTPNWSLDSEGFYRTDDGYYVVAANGGQYSQGDIIETSKGPAQVLDSGCAYGTTDFYTAW